MQRRSIALSGSSGSSRSLKWPKTVAVSSLLIELALEGAKRKQETSKYSFHSIINSLLRFSVDSTISGLSSRSSRAHSSID